MRTSLFAGVVFGMSAGFSPGPLLTLVLAQTLQHGTREGIRVALAPLVTDIPIILAAVFALSKLANAHGALGAVSIGGGLFVLYLAVETLRTHGIEQGLKEAAPRSLSRGAVVNLLNPQPYLFWFTVGAPLLIAAWKSNAVSAIAFLAGFYGCLVGAKVFLAAVAGRSRGVLTDRIYRWLMRVLGVLLVVFAALMVRDGLRMLGVPGR